MGPRPIVADDHLRREEDEAPIEEKAAIAY